MRERPIIFSGPMVLAILDERKSMTRRVVKPQPEWAKGGVAFIGRRVATYDALCPYGQPGDLLYVKETYRHICNLWQGEGPAVAGVKYRADDSARNCGSWPTLKAAPKERWWNTGKQPWQPAIFMPRWASRLTLENRANRIERVQDITEEDARAEGFECREHFIRYWDSLNKKRGHGFDENDYVWAISFERVTP